MACTTLFMFLVFTSISVLKAASSTLPTSAININQHNLDKKAVGFIEHGLSPSKRSSHHCPSWTYWSGRTCDGTIKDLQWARDLCLPRDTQTNQFVAITDQICASDAICIGTRYQQTPVSNALCVPAYKFSPGFPLTGPGYNIGEAEFFGDNNPSISIQWKSYSLTLDRDIPFASVSAVLLGFGLDFAIRPVNAISVQIRGKPDQDKLCNFNWDTLYCEISEVNWTFVKGDILDFTFAITSDQWVHLMWAVTGVNVVIPGPP